MRDIKFGTATLTLAAVALTGAIGAASGPPSTRPADPGALANAAMIERGAHLVKTMACNDCHTPWKLGPNGPEPDMTRELTGHPQELVMPPAPKLPPGPWLWTAAATNTAFAGPWGVSFTANLTPDKETGLGDWTVDQFIATMRTARHQGKGRQLLPPMPVQILAALDDQDIRAVFAYLQSLPPVRNRVPQPIDPPEGAR